MAAEDEQQKEITELRRKLGEATGRIERLESEKRELQIQLEGLKTNVEEMRIKLKDLGESA